MLPATIASVVRVKPEPYQAGPMPNGSMTRDFRRAGVERGRSGVNGHACWHLPRSHDLGVAALLWFLGRAEMRKGLARMREALEEKQVVIYFAAVILAALAAFSVPGTTLLEPAINPALAFMLFVTFLQVPVSDLGRSFSRFQNGRASCRERVCQYV